MTIHGGMAAYRHARININAALAQASGLEQAASVASTGVRMARDYLSSIEQYRRGIDRTAQRSKIRRGIRARSGAT